MRPQRRQHRQPHLTRRSVTLLQRQIRSHLAGDQRSIGTKRTMPGDIRHPLNHNHWPIHRNRLGRARQFEREGGKTLFGCHGLNV